MTTLADLRLTPDDIDRLTMAEADTGRWTTPLHEADVVGGRGAVHDDAERFRRRLDRAETAAIREVLDGWVKVRSTLNGELDRLDAILKADDSNDAIRAAVDRLEDQRDQLARRVDGYARQVAQSVTDVHAKAAKIGADATKSMVDRQLPPGAATSGVTFNRLPADAIEQILGQLQSTPLQTLLSSWGTEYTAALSQQLVDGIALGRSPRDVARRMARTADMPRWKALQVARTETLRAYRETSRRSVMADRDVIAGTVWSSTLSSTTCAMCWAMHGTQFGPGEAMATHPNCRCTLIPRTKSWAELGFGGIEEPPELNVTAGPELFARQPASLQRQVLGPAKYQAWTDGRFELPDLVGRKFDRDWGASRFERPLNDLLAA